MHWQQKLYEQLNILHVITSTNSFVVKVVFLQLKTLKLGNG